MSSSTLWLRFRKFRTVVFSLASIVCLIWSIVISVYMANNWSSYNGGQRGFLFGLIALDFLSAILIYLMAVVKYRFWPDAARAVVLVGLHTAGAVTFMIYSPRFPCNAFGSAAHCHMYTEAVLAGLWVVSALLIVYSIWLPVMAVIPSPPTPSTRDDLENAPVEKTEEEEGSEEEKRKSHVSSSSRAWLLKNQEGTSPELVPTGLPPQPRLPGALRVHSHASSSLSSLNYPQPSSPLVQEITFDSYRGQPDAPPSASVYSVSSPQSMAHTLRAPSISAAGDLNTSGSSSGSSASQLPTRTSSLQSSHVPNRFDVEVTDENRVSVVSTSSYESASTQFEYSAVPGTISEAPRRSVTITADSSSSLSVYSQSSAPSRSTSPPGVVQSNAPKSVNNLRSLPSSPLAGRQPRQPIRQPTQPSTPQSPRQDSVHSMMGSVHDHADQVIEFGRPTSGFLSPPLTALPTPSFSAGSGQTTFELHLSDSPRSQPVDVGDLPNIASGRQPELSRQGSMATIMSAATARPPHVRNDSAASNVDMDEWRKLVLNAAGKT
ncbi:hypothetical protein HYDPIDRAFT_105533 [Hydnomerulius pinastri MD-312]|nr:hypothetical protein HYDPIDRAFT_105533 [Hydnomerulius pinastri MD-312]